MVAPLPYERRRARTARKVVDRALGALLTLLAALLGGLLLSVALFGLGLVP